MKHGRRDGQKTVTLQTFESQKLQFLSFVSDSFEKMLTCSVSENIPVNSNHPGRIFQAWVAVLLDYFCIGVIMRNDLGAVACGDTEALMTFPTQNQPTTHLSCSPFCNLEI